MDKRLHDLKDEFNNIPISFSDTNRKAVRTKIQELERKPVQKQVSLIPKVITGMAISVAVLIFVITINNQPNLLNTTSNDNAAVEDSIEGSEMEIFDADEDSASNFEVIEEEKSTAQDNLTNYSSNTLFNPETIQANGRYGNMFVESVTESKDSTIISFTGSGSISGQFIDDNPLKFLPDEESLLELPIAETDVNREISFYFKNEDLARYYKNNMESATNGVAKFDIIKLEYHHSQDIGSKVYVTILDEYGIPSISLTEHESTIELSDELLTIYKQYEATFDEELLKGLSPFDVFRLHYHAIFENNLDVEYGLYIKNENSIYPDKEAFLSERSDSSTDESEKHYYNMLEINHFDETYLSDNEALIRFTLDNHHMAFRLHKDEELGVWKVGWLALQ
ncbi:hypothetical protein [Ornithinibacillus halotolerans]|uniref:Uncharacterized protein n=1 Tax=Ornithinibacillus halotolerans TaxID=1274357 RepID=A0A916WAQ8_9BACI|nr:hypothetical protein [Ornithinibacillus halotolerans]GGA83366.1 hypothetical protein GCM10008025_28160 [Ornithinibacillus halotolerans]